jgi:hypothetical protein
LTPRARVLLLCSLVLACKPGPSPADEDASENSGTEGSGSDESGGVEDLPASGGECELVVDDCMDPTLKCMPYADGPGLADGTRCCDLDPDPVTPGERCTVQDGLGSCLDDCPAGSLCMVDDVETLGGHCQRFCDVVNPDSCAADEVCMTLGLARDAVSVPVCLASCDPLQQDCESEDRPGWACLPTGPLAPAFVCLPPTGPAAKLEYESCMVGSNCAIGLMCLPGELVLGCEGLFSCCTRYCDINEPNTCTTGNECVGLGASVPGLEHVGLCADPA